MNGKKENILVSACLLGVDCRYDGKNGRNEGVIALMRDYNLIPVCPEQLGGLMTPREPAEIKVGNTVITQSGKDVTANFKQGAAETLKIARLYGCKRAVLKERSPSCGHGTIYDGTFRGKKIAGSGITARYLEDNAIAVKGESEIASLRF